ncbi:MAG: hypothetical protein QOG73_825 [Acetobacteraceae bacterium]|nr:hypothetical protein [Acetobacteraceae bacterium]
MKLLSTSALLNSVRDPRIDVLRGIALLMIFVDHISADWLNRITMHNFGFCDAAEVFVLLAGMSSMFAYGKIFHRDGIKPALRKIVARCSRIYLFQIGLTSTTIGVVLVWRNVYHLDPGSIAPILGAPVEGLVHVLTLSALPEYLDILPLYIVLLVAFPLIYLAIRLSLAFALCGSALLWLTAQLMPALNLPNWIDGQGWYFDPFAWQFLFVIGACLALAVREHRQILPNYPKLRYLAVAFLAFACLESIPWQAWRLPDLQLLGMAVPDKSRLAPLRILDILSLMYLLLSSPRVARLARSAWLRPLEACGKHSLEVFSTGCLLALFGRLALDIDGQSTSVEFAVNLVGIGAMGLVGSWLERGGVQGLAPKPDVALAASGIAE